MVLTILTIIGTICLFLYGMAMMSRGLTKYTGDGRRFLPMMNGNKFQGVCAGAGLTSLVQSSRVSTVMIVSYVNAGLLTLAKAVPVIMGANIGTTITIWLITLVTYTLKLAPYAYILCAIGFVLNSSKNANRKDLGRLLIAISLMFIALWYLQDAVNTLSASPACPEFLQPWTDHGFGSVLIFTLLGLLLAFLFQSSSAAMSLTIVMLAAGWLPYTLAIAMVLGENIGTTLNVTIAANRGDLPARQAALVHVLFNVGCAILALILFNPFVKIVSGIISLFSGVDPALVSPAESSAPLLGVCLSHTMFNLLGTCVMVWLSGFIMNIVSKLVVVEKKPADSHLKYIGNGRLGTPALSISQALNEAVNMGQICYEGFDYVRKAINESDNDKFDEWHDKLVEYEEITDKMEYEIAAFLNDITTDELTRSEDEEIKVLYRIISEMESLGDSGENIGRLMERVRIHGIKFDSLMMSKLNTLVDKVDNAYQAMNYNLTTATTSGLTEISNAYSAENDINNTRNALRNEAIEMIDAKQSNYQSINYFLDLLSELEAMGDFMINISQAALLK